MNRKERRTPLARSDADERWLAMCIRYVGWADPDPGTAADGRKEIEYITRIMASSIESPAWSPSLC